MIIVLKPGASEDEINHVLDRIKSLGFEIMVSRGVQRTIIGVIGEEDRLRERQKGNSAVSQHPCFPTISGGQRTRSSWITISFLVFEYRDPPGCATQRRQADRRRGLE